MDEWTLLERIKEMYSSILRDKLVGIYVHGSIAFDCFHWDSSDIDFLVVVNKKMLVQEKVFLITALLDLDEYAPNKGFEMSVVLDSVCKPFVYPTPYEVHYSNAYKELYKEDISQCFTGTQQADPDLAAHITVIKDKGIVLCGKEIDDVFGDVPRKDYLDSIQMDIMDAKKHINQNPVYYILNLCRVCAYVEEGFVLSKEEGGMWAMSHLPEPFTKMVSMALDSYRKNKAFTWQKESLEPFVELLFSKIFIKDVDVYTTKCIRNNVNNLPYSLHDMIITVSAINQDVLCLYFEDGFLKIGNPCKRVKGFLQFEGLDWNFCYMYILDVKDEIVSGKKMELLSYLEKHLNVKLEIIDEVYGYNKSKFFGCLWENDGVKEFIMEIYHSKDMIYFTNE